MSIVGFRSITFDEGREMLTFYQLIFAALFQGKMKNKGVKKFSKNNDKTTISLAFRFVSMSQGSGGNSYVSYYLSILKFHVRSELVLGKLIK